MSRKIILSLLAALGVGVAMAQSYDAPPKLVINIVVGAMRSGDIERYRSNFGDSGFVRLAEGGMNYTNANYNYQQTTTPVSLATLTTGALPTTHGVIARGWWEYILGDRVELIHEKGVRNLNYNLRDYGYSASRLVAPNLSESLMQESAESQSVSVALDPVASIVMSGRVGAPYWIDPLTCEWGSSTAFMEALPEWVVKYNKMPNVESIAGEKWISNLNQDFYKNRFYTKLQPRSMSHKYEAENLTKSNVRSQQNKITYEQLAYTPAGNSAIFDYAKSAVENMKLGVDEHPDLMNIYLDPARNISQRYGVQSVEVEDMYSHLDNDLDDFLNFLTRTLKSGDVVVVLSSDHGMSPAYGDDSQPVGRFNSQQFEVLVNSFLRARYGDDGWVLGYEDRNLYLNHKLIFKHELSISEVQNEVASFALQFRGVAHALTASSMRNGYFGSGYGHKMQNSFYPRRSGDVVINFTPGWIEQSENRAESGSTYRYDSHVPLIIYAEGYFVGRRVNREVSMIDLAPTLAQILGIERPAAAEGEPLSEIF